MGTDIHVIVERRERDASPWERVRTRGYYDRPNHFGIGKSEWRALGIGEVDAPDALTARCYDVFSLLADVRNGYGFAGVSTGAGWNPLDTPRGLPDDSTLSEREKDDCTVGDHSFSHATVRELLTFFETPQHTTKCGVIELDAYVKWSSRPREWKDRHAPQEYSGGVSGPNIVIIDEIDGDTKRTETYARTLVGKRVHVRATWPMTAIQAAQSFYECALPWLTALGDPDRVRIVFGFDS